MREEEHELKVFKELIMEFGKMRPKMKSAEIHMGFFVCKLCGYISDNKIKSSQHRKRHCNMPVFPYSCSVGNSCKLCKKHVVNEEYHYILECKAISKVRFKCLPKILCRRPNPSKFYKLINSDTKTFKRLCKFICIVCKKLA